MHTNTGTRPITALTARALLPAVASPARGLTLPAAAGGAGDDPLRTPPYELATDGGCGNHSCCNPEYLDEQDCEDLDCSPGHLCVRKRCVLQ